MQKIVGMLMMVTEHNKTVILNKYLVYCIKMYEIYYHQFRLVIHQPIQSLFYEERLDRELKLRYTIDRSIQGLYE